MADLTIQDLTTGAIDGDGIFDSLMRSLRAHLEREHEENRITGDAFANVYLGSLTAVLQNATQFALTKDQSALQAQLLEAQILKMGEEQALVAQQRQNMIAEHANILAQNEKLVAEKALVEAQVASVTSDNQLKAQQILNLQAEALLIPKQGLKLDAEIEVANAQVLKVAADTALTDQQKLNMVVEKDNMAKQGDQLVAQTALTTSQKAKVDADVQLTAQQKTNLITENTNLTKQGTLLDAQVTKSAADTSLVTANKELAVVEKTLRTEQVTKTQQEVAVLQQRVKNEKAQISDTVDGVAVTGIIGKQRDLHAAQIDGFKRDAEYKATKLMTDIWVTQRSTDDGISPAGAGLADAEIAKFVAVLKTGVGVTS
jgi:hypothetical protein